MLRWSHFADNYQQQFAGFQRCMEHSLEWSDREVLYRVWLISPWTINRQDRHAQPCHDCKNKWRKMFHPSHLNDNITIQVNAKCRKDKQNINMSIQAVEVGQTKLQFLTCSFNENWHPFIKWRGQIFGVVLHYIDDVLKFWDSHLFYTCPLLSPQLFWIILSFFPWL